jgi:hypothetical protein
LLPITYHGWVGPAGLAGCGAERDGEPLDAVAVVAEVGGGGVGAEAGGGYDGGSPEAVSWVFTGGACW